MMTKLIAFIAAFMILGIVQAAAVVTNPQRMAIGFPFPVYVNNTGTAQSQVRGVYVNQTQTGSASTSKLMFGPKP